MKGFVDDGSEGECGPGDVVAIPPGHDAEVVGDEPCVFIDFGEFGDYAKRDRRRVQPSSPSCSTSHSVWRARSA